jgi:hypothetical protein
VGTFAARWWEWGSRKLVQGAEYYSAMATFQGHEAPLRAGFVTLAVVIALSGGAAEAGRREVARSSACKAGVHRVGGVSARTFCGPATARLVVGGKTFTFAQGNCVKTATYVSINIGTVVLGQTKQRQPNYFGLDIGRIPGSGAPPAGQDGTYRTGTVLTVEYANKSYDVLSGIASLKGHRTHGTVKGKAFSGQPLAGTFHC